MVSGDYPPWKPSIEYERFPFDNPIDSHPFESIDTMDRENERTQVAWDYETDYQDEVGIIPPSSSTSMDDLIASSTTERDETTTQITQGISISIVHIDNCSVLRTQRREFQ